jgi:diadenosine tetraphosphate (Ap4A) HIT family hydrolase
MKCPFCEIVKDKKEYILAENKSVYVTLSNPRLMPGHLLVIPKRHVEKICELTKDEREDFFDMTIKIQEKVLKEIAPGCDICEHYRPFIPDNAYKISHLHMHIRPRFLDDELYLKVQKFENQVFKKIGEIDFEKYKSILAE